MLEKLEQLVQHWNDQLKIRKLTEAERKIIKEFIEDTLLTMGRI